MGELSEDSGSSARVAVGDGGQAGPDQPDRPKLVALPEPAAVPAAPAAAAAALADADRLALERSLSGPPVLGPWIAGTLSRPPAADANAAAAAAPSYATLQPHAIADATAFTATPELVQALRAELTMRAHAEAGLRARAVDAETRLATRLLMSQRSIEALRLVGAELDQLGGMLTDERARRRAAEQRVAELERQLATNRGRSDDAAVEIAEIRGSLQQLRTPADGQAAAAPGGESGDDASQTAATEVRAERLDDALTRLRAGAGPVEPLPEPAVALAPGTPTPATPPPANTAVTAIARKATLAGPFRTLCRRDPALAGQLALSLLPMQRIAYPQPISYDIVLGPGHGCVQVTSSDDATEIARLATARPRQQVDMHIVGGPERFAKLLAAGRIRRRLGFGVARVRGHRDGLAALDALLALPLDLRVLADGGMSTEPSILLSLVAAVVRPDWTRGARFSISHRDGNAPPTYLLIAEGHKPTVTTVAPAGPITTVISCAQSDLASVLTGSPPLAPGAAHVAGDPVPLAQLQTWIKRAQSE
jgi:hypothetical protein